MGDLVLGKNFFPQTSDDIIFFPGINNLTM